MNFCHPPISYQKVKADVPLLIAFALETNSDIQPATICSRLNILTISYRNM